jgi:hypothetical protein
MRGNLRKEGSVTRIRSLAESFRGFKFSKVMLTELGILREYLKEFSFVF